MPWIKLVEKKHNCFLEPGSLPNPKEAYELGAQVGSIYECDNEKCNRRWKLTDSPRDGLYWSEDTHHAMINAIKKNTP